MTAFFFADITEEEAAKRVLKNEIETARRLESLASFYRDKIRTRIEEITAQFLEDTTSDPAKVGEIPSVEPDPELSTFSFEVLLKSMLQGIGASRSSDFADPLPDPLPFEDAAAFMGVRIPLTKREFKSLSDKLRYRAFTVSRLTELDAINAVRLHLKKVIETGESLKRFQDKTNAAEMLGIAGWGGEVPGYWENVYRTNIQTCFNSGRLLGFEKDPPEYLEFIGIEDSRQTDICQERTGTIRPFRDPYWSTNIPPLHYQCRSTVRGIYKEEAEIRGIKQTDIPEAMPPLRGFGSNPLVFDKYWKPTESMMKRIRGYAIVDEINKSAKQLNLDFEIPAAHGLAQEFPVKTYADIETLLGEYASRNPDMFKDGFKKLVVDRYYKFFASTDTKGIIRVSNNRFIASGGYHPAIDLKAAMKKIARNQPLSFNEEYAVETLWHEILHNARKGVIELGDNPRSNSIRILMEATNQLYARHTYDNFLSQLGVSARFSGKILEGGYGYRPQVKNLRFLINRLGLVERETAESLHLLLDSDWSDIYDRSSLFLSMASGKNQKIIKALLAAIQVSPRIFQELATKLLL
jgi:SPP1 gp7 family putative phage head morphogenesis protein